MVTAGSRESSKHGGSLFFDSGSSFFGGSGGGGAGGGGERNSFGSCGRNSCSFGGGGGGGGSLHSNPGLLAQVLWTESPIELAAHKQGELSAPSMRLIVHRHSRYLLESYDCGDYPGSLARIPQNTHPFWIVLQIFFFFLPGTFCEVMPTHYPHKRHGNGDGGHGGGHISTCLSVQQLSPRRTDGAAGSSSLMSRLRRRFASVAPDDTAATLQPQPHQRQGGGGGGGGGGACGGGVGANGTAARAFVWQAPGNQAAGGGADRLSRGSGACGSVIERDSERLGALQRSRTYRIASKVQQRKRSLTQRRAVAVVGSGWGGWGGCAFACACVR